MTEMTPNSIPQRTGGNWASKKNTITLVLDFAGKIKTLILNYFSPIIVGMFILWLVYSNFFWNVYTVITSSTVWSWISILTVLVSLLIIAAYVFAWLWVFNATNSEESISTFIHWLKDDKSLSLWLSSAITVQIVYFLILGIFIVFWYFVGYNIWQIFVKILSTITTSFQVWIFNGMFWKNMFTIILSMGLFLVVVWVVPLMAQASNMFRAKVQSWAGMSRGILWLLAGIMIVAVAATVTGMKIINSVDVVWSLQQQTSNLNLTNF